MKYEDKEFIVLMISWVVFMLATLCQMIWGWPNDQYLFYASCIWLVAACISGVYSWYLETKQ